MKMSSTCDFLSSVQIGTVSAPFSNIEFLLFYTIFLPLDHGHKKFGRLWEQIIFPYDKLATAYAHWVISPIQIVAELRDPTKLKKPKRPELIHPPTTLQFRQNSADLNGAPNFGGQFDAPLSDEEAEHSRQRMFLDIKKEPYEEDHSSVSQF